MHWQPRLHDSCCLFDTPTEGSTAIDGSIPILLYLIKAGFINTLQDMINYNDDTGTTDTLLTNNSNSA